MKLKSQVLFIFGNLRILFQSCLSDLGNGANLHTLEMIFLYQRTSLNIIFFLESDCFLNGNLDILWNVSPLPIKISFYKPGAALSIAMAEIKWNMEEDFSHQWKWQSQKMNWIPFRWIFYGSADLFRVT